MLFAADWYYGLIMLVLLALEFKGRMMPNNTIIIYIFMFLFSIYVFDGLLKNRVLWVILRTG